MILLLSIGFFLAWTVTVAIGDFRYRRIPNSLVVAGLICGFAAVAAGHNPFGITIAGAIIGISVAFVGLFPFFAWRLTGAADVKVFMALGAWCGWKILFWSWIVASLAALIHVIGILYLTRMPIGALWQRGGPALAFGGYRGSPYAAFLVIPAAAWLIYQIVTGNMR
ncbi:A24 family peptidase [Burkholderia gladioli]|uniref:A24 family peptidase n=1 Tax=Burkholderia gladioli TaxID=28095 RepID=UPI00163E38AD|nr:prepilin peptidase [Burkholderia gladioli]MDN7803209.1 prepilin peptidase [Burkholderia gladioli]